MYRALGHAIEIHVRRLGDQDVVDQAVIIFKGSRPLHVPHGVCTPQKDPLVIEKILLPGHRILPCLECPESEIEALAGVSFPTFLVDTGHDNGVEMGRIKVPQLNVKIIDFNPKPKGVFPGTGQRTT